MFENYKMYVECFSDDVRVKKIHLSDIFHEKIKTQFPFLIRGSMTKDTIEIESKKIGYRIHFLIENDTFIVKIKLPSLGKKIVQEIIDEFTSVMNIFDINKE
jgi:hypothetical protein